VGSGGGRLGRPQSVESRSEAPTGNPIDARCGSTPVIVPISRCALARCASPVKRPRSWIPASLSAGVAVARKRRSPQRIDHRPAVIVPSSPRATSLASGARRARSPTLRRASSQHADHVSACEIVGRVWGTRPLATPVQSTDVCSSRFGFQDDCPLVSGHSASFPTTREPSVHAARPTSAGRPARSRRCLPRSTSCRRTSDASSLRGLAGRARQRPPVSARGARVLIASLGSHPRA
jgi:hypothetical protein